MKHYMLDTNTVSHLLKRHPAVSCRLVTVPMSALCISAITAGELRYGLAKRPDAKRIHALVREFLGRVDVLPWSNETTERYGVLRATMEREGKVLAPLDLLIATHALAVDAVLVTNDQAFSRVPGLEREDWTQG